ncbi:MAG TPA: peptidylprolyl isomerase [Casimicrobiaceae bacterium]|jgi:peptidyl-prolyl cis-trans isomerase A (cyclophilin A)/peptidyl-prolyl cis-trans isomerase B (cyclophilin B)|nr:peptidylprolyl isomerase [Casimicrobiaceae bacterium]
MSHRIATLAFAAIASLAAAGIATAANPQVELDTTQGKIRIEVYPEAAPKTVANFLQYVKDGFYSGTQFHRVIPGFMVQGGGMSADFKEKPTRPPVPIESEQSVKAGLSNGVGSVSMARTSDPNSATAQFFINVADNKRLDFQSADARGYGYTVFGKVVDGMDVVNKIAAAPTGPGGPFPRDVPQQRVVINAAKVITP